MSVNPKLYAEIFEDDRRGAAILEDLVRRFGEKVYVAGGHEADRQTCYNAGKRDVVEFIISRINMARSPEGEANE